MKKVVLSLMLFVGIYSNAQLGIITLEKKENPFYGQWYVINSKEYKNQLFYFDKKEKVDSVLMSMLDPYDLKQSDARKDEAGDSYWVVDNDNGFNSTVYLVKIDQNDSQIIIVTIEN